jgi:elongation factor G
MPSRETREVPVSDLLEEWPRMVDVTDCRIYPKDATNGVAARLVDASGAAHTLKLSPRATVKFCVLMSRHPDAVQALLEERIGGVGFRLDEFAPALEAVVELLDKSGQTDARSILSGVVAGDPGLQLTLDAATGTLILAGLDWGQLDQKISAFRMAYAGDIQVRHQVSYREQITQRTEIDYCHKRHSGGVSEFARVKIVLEPLPYWQGVSFTGIRVRQALSEEYLSAVEHGVKTCLSAGVLSGHPVIGLRVLLVEAEAHPTDSSPLAFELAARAAVREALRQAAPVLLEPIVRLDVVAPEADAAAVAADIRERRGETDGRGRRSPQGIVITARIPAANLGGFAPSLRKIAGESAWYLPQFDGYAPVPGPEDSRFRPAAALRA